MALKFNLVTNAVPVVLSVNGQDETYELREMTAAARDQYMDSTRTRMSVGPDGRASGINRFEGFQADLLSRCLFRPDGKAVPQNVIQTWPSSVVSGLFREAQTLNLLNKTDDEEPARKNG